MNVLNLEKMKAKLIKTPEQFYKLKFYNDEDMLACATALLSKQNCDEIFGIVDVEKIADRHTFGQRNHEWKAYIKGFSKARELNKDKQFTYDQMVSAIAESSISHRLPSLIIQSLQQPTEIEVEILMQCIDPNCDSLNRKGCCIPGDKPRINAEGYLTLKKI
jgi:hypothetical protein